MNTNIPLSVQPIQIPDIGAQYQRAMTMRALLGQQQLQGLQLEQAKRENAKAAALEDLARSSGGNMEQFLSGYGKIDPLGAMTTGVKLRTDQRAEEKAKLDLLGKQAERTAQLVSSVLLADPATKPQAYLQARNQAIAENLIKEGDPSYPATYSPQVEAKLRQVAQQALQTKDALERMDYSALGTPGAPSAPDGPTTMNQYVNGGVPNYTGPKAQKLPYSEENLALLQNLPGQEAGFQSQLATTGQAAAPAVETTGKRQITPDDYRREATRLEALGTKAASERAKVYRDEANRLDDRIGREANQAEQIRIREEAIALRKSNQGNQARVNASKLADDFRQEPGVKDYRTVQPLIASMENAIVKDTGTADLDMVYALAKIFDPGSVVREGEQILVVKAGGLPSQVQDWIGWVNGGQRLNPQVRAGMLEQAQSRAANYKQAYDSAVRSYTEQAKRWELDPRDIIRDYKVVSEASKGKGPRKGVGSGTQEDPFKIKGDEGYGSVKSGEYFMGPDGQLRRKP